VVALSGFDLKMSASSLSSRLGVVWFRNNLRLHDNALLHEATKHHDQILCVYVIDPRLFPLSSDSIDHVEKLSCRRASFLLESLDDLRQSLLKINQQLVVTIGRPEECIPYVHGSSLDNTLSALISEHGCHIYVEEEVGTYEDKLIKRLADNIRLNDKISLRVLDNVQALHSKVALAFTNDLSDLPKSFTKFRKFVEGKTNPQEILNSIWPTVSVGELGTCPIPSVSDSLPSLLNLGYSDDEIHQMEALRKLGSLPFNGGESHALSRLHTWIFESDNLKDYLHRRNGLLGESFSSKLSPWLAVGCLSVRTVYQEVKRYEKEVISNESTAWFKSHLTVRDFYHYIALKHGRALFQRHGVQGHPNAAFSGSWRDRNDTRTIELVSSWMKGSTGVPIIDACMRELMSTGYMSNRGRQIVASFLIWDAGMNWRIGARFFERMLLDYDIASNYGSWVSAAGLLHNRINRFHVIQQSRDFDPDGDFIRYWMPELRAIPCGCQLIHEPWKLSVDEQSQFMLTIGESYPAPMIEYNDQEDVGGNKNGKKKANVGSTLPRKFDSATAIG
jgi:deoxyribodipyrimidine photo-lyase